MLDKRPGFGQREAVHIDFREGYSVRVAHGDAADVEGVSVDVQSIIGNRFVAGGGRGNLISPETRLSHGHLRAGHHALLPDRLDLPQSRGGLDVYDGLSGRQNALVEGEPDEAADAVPAHEPLRTVRVEHGHAQVGPIRWSRQDDAVGADALVPVAHCDGERGPIAVFSPTVDVQVVVPCPMQLCESQSKPLRS